MVPFLGRLIFKQYLKRKPKYVVSKYLSCVVMKARKRARNVAAKVVFELVEPYETLEEQNILIIGIPVSHWM